ncbi:hypothetical protein ACFCX4_32980 [Kitasatospora sp. NPDC056327]|uniref:hypothetical protein n=1 Tax=Kitasatospora sp. NPDC056327 TaxID=3345785 RepID=UPI0035DD5AF9
MKRTRALAVAGLLAVCVAAGAGPAAAADEELLPHPGPDGLVWVPVWTGPGGVASAGAWGTLPTVVTVACAGGGTADVTLHSAAGLAAAFTVDCPVGATGTGSAAVAPGVVEGAFDVGVRTSSGTIRWGLTVVQPE